MNFFHFGEQVVDREGLTHGQPGLTELLQIKPIYLIKESEALHQTGSTWTSVISLSFLSFENGCSMLISSGCLTMWDSNTIASHLAKDLQGLTFGNNI